MVLACCKLLGLTVASPKLRIFRADWTYLVSYAPPWRTLHEPNWSPEKIPVQVDDATRKGSWRTLCYDLALTGQTLLDLFHYEAKTAAGGCEIQTSLP